jgi:hypothetical protein
MEQWLMKICLWLLIMFLFCDYTYAQNDTLVNKFDSPNKKTDTIGRQIDSINPNIHVESTGLTFSSYFILLGDDLKQDITAPFHQTPKQWLHIGMYCASVSALSIIADEPVQRFAVRLHDSSKAVSSISGYATNFGGRYELYTLAALEGYGLIFNDRKMQTTVLLSTQAYITSGLIESLVKYLTGRQRPSYYDPHHPEPEPYFHGPSFSSGNNAYGHKINASFPSGHTTVAFAVATVFAKEYQNTVWVPAMAYSVASLVGLSRITENKHWTTDVVVGSTLGFLCGRQVVNNYHRYIKSKTSSKNGTLSFTIDYNGNNFEPGIVYTFRK